MRNLRHRPRKLPYANTYTHTAVSVAGKGRISCFRSRISGRLRACGRGGRDVGGNTLRTIFAVIPFASERTKCGSFFSLSSQKPAEKQLAATTTELVGGATSAAAAALRLLPIIGALIALVLFLVLVAVIVAIVFR